MNWSLVLFFFVFYGASRVQAGINIFNGNFSLTETELQGERLPVQIHRTYNSKSRFHGLFGIGWCSNLETKLTIENRRLKIQECGSGRTVKYELDLASQVYRSLSHSNQTVEKVGLQYRRIFSGQGFETFDSEGYLLERSFASGENFVISRDPISKAIRSFRTRDGSVVTFTSKNSGTFMVMEFAAKKTTYALTSGNLTGVTDSEGQKTEYQYDGNHNLILKTDANGDVTKISYDPTKGRATQLVTPNHCNHKIQYELLHSDSREIEKYDVKVSKTCGALETTKKYRITYRDDGTPVALEEAGAASPLRVFYGESFPKIEKKSHGTVVTTYDYDDLGRVSSARSGRHLLTYTYEKKSSRPIRVMLKTSVNGISRDLASIGTYDALDRLTKVKSSEGTYQYSYDSHNRVQSVEFDDRKSIKIGYDSLGRPEKIAPSSGQEIRLIYGQGRAQLRSPTDQDRFDKTVDLYQKAVDATVAFSSPSLIENL